MERRARRPHSVIVQPHDQSIRYIALTQDKLAIVDAEDFERVSRLTWSANRRKNLWYARHFRKIAPGKNESFSLHHFILGVGRGTLVDHRDGDGLNCRRSNLRISSVHGNTHNRKGVNRFKGVQWRKEMNKWVAQITAYGQWHYLGCHATEVEAARAYDEAAKRYQGEYARLNFPHQSPKS